MLDFKIGDKIIINDPGSIWDEKEGIIREIPTDSEADITVKVIFSHDPENNPKYILQKFPREVIKQQPKSEALTEKMENKYNYIDRYLHKINLDGDVSASWFFVDTLNVLENRTCESIIADAKKFGYKVFEIMAYDYDKFIVADKDYTIERLYDEYGDFLLGPVAIREA